MDSCAHKHVCPNHPAQEPNRHHRVDNDASAQERLRMLLIRMCETIPMEGRIAM